ncbi:S-layer homology domain-containing protein [Paenibacillus thiaminolyticus]|uniref:S-layer homology domain-containing protein n=1 Tax=Paenibacillus thiaminolyticus TaxID=49283 RepID=UPI00234FC785|nr:S-layer homology domain-containing protein [Paenibacillus thiaminolyticus]WCR26701.1 S-layer homology domain-containing protein [Paenibacillus thiaminolyticus]
MKNRDQRTRLRLALSILFASICALMLLPDQVSAKQVQAEYIKQIVYKPSGFSGMMHFYSDGSKVSFIDVDKGTLHARWVSFIPLSAFQEGVELYYSRDGITAEKQFIKMQNWNDAPADLKWLTISNFDGAFGEGHGITNQQYRYSVDGIHILSGPEVPANALWATLSEYDTVWSGEHKTLDYDRSYGTYTLDIDSIRTVAIASNHATNTSIAKAGHEVTLSFTAIFPLKKATVTIAGHPIEAKEESGKWTARYRLTSADAEGEIDFRIDYKEADSDIVKSRTETTDGSSVRFDNTPPGIALSPSTKTPTNKEVTVTAGILDEESGIAVQKWAPGEQSITFFANGGNALAGSSFNISSNGAYTVYAKDRAGNEAVATIMISNIYKQAPQLTLTRSPDTWTNQPVTISVVIGTDQGIAVKLQKWARGKQPSSYFQDDGELLGGNSFIVNDNGDYTVYVQDEAGNEAIAQIAITNVNTTPPHIQSTLEPSGWTNQPVTVNVLATHEAGEIKVLKWGEGIRPASFFETEGSVIADSRFTVYANGDYTIFAQDEAGNAAVEYIEVKQIDIDKPVIQLSVDPEGKTNGNVMIEARITDRTSSIARQKWAAGKQPESYFESGGTSFTGSDSFEVEVNDVYTVYAQDKAGNSAIATIEVTNIHRLEPVISLTLFPTEPTQGPVTVTASVYSPIDIADRKMALGLHDAAFFHSEGEPWAQPIEVQDNGWISFYATDTAGNETVKQLEITNIDREKPVIILIGEPVIHFVQGTGFQDPGASAIDNADGDISASIIVSGQVNTQIPGEYILRYNVTDKAGNAADEVIRTVKVTARPVVDDNDNGSSHEGGSSSPQDDHMVPAQVPQHNERKDKEETKQPDVPEDIKQCAPEGACDSTRSIPRFTDVEGHWASEAILKLAAAGVITGYPDGTFKPSRSLMRAEFVTLLVHALKLEMHREPIFTDSANHWASEAISIAQDYGLIKGYNANTFGPDDRITREQMAAVIARVYAGDRVPSSEELPALAYEDAADISAWAADAVHWVTGQQIMIGNDQRQFRPKGFTSRAEAAVVLVKLRAKST